MMTTSQCRAPLRAVACPSPTPDPHSAQNHLLAALPRDSYARLSDHLVPVNLALGAVVCDGGSRQQFAYFPTTAMLSLLCITADGATTEMAAIGNEGLAGVGLLLGDEHSPHRLVVQCAGEALCVRAAILKAEFNRGGSLHELLLRYTQALLTQTGQTAVCNRHHSVEEQLCRRLLSSLDRNNNQEIVVTQERLAHMLGVRREGVTEAACKLQRAGLIRYRRGHIAILNRDRMETLACECYRVIKREFERLLPETMVI